MFLRLLCLCSIKEETRGGGSGVQSVTSADSFIDVNNTDPSNPVLSLDVATLAADPTFIGDVITNINASGNVTVVTDGVTVTGDGTTGNPLVAPGGGGDTYQVKASVADTTPSYLDNKINIHSSDNSVIVTKTITNPSGNEVVDYDVKVSSTPSTVNVNAFDDFVSVFQITNGGSGQQYVASGNEPKEFLWNAKPRFGKTLTSYAL